jgi:hypothetical protein
MICLFGYYESCDVTIGKTRYNFRGVANPNPDESWYPPSSSSWRFTKTETEMIECLKSDIKELHKKCEVALGLDWKPIENRDDLTDDRLLLFDETFNRIVVGQLFLDRSGFESNDEFCEITHYKKIDKP